MKRANPDALRLRTPSVCTDQLVGLNDLRGDAVVLGDQVLAGRRGWRLL
jgi:hypothetical protein